jgi:hypothetical protein
MADEWWTHAYPGGKLVAVNGFPRPVYPPDVTPGRVPSIDGSDIEAYKRTVSRAGRWEWQAFDQQFSNAFSHGKAGGNVGESGIAGIQRQQNLDPSGWIGQQTFNTLRSIRIPEGLPHAGEMAMDARSVELINAAWKRFKGSAQPESSSGTAAQARLAQAQSQIGVKESPPNSNQCRFTDWYGMVGPWCAMFTSWADQTGIRPTHSFVRGTLYAYVPYIVSDARLGLNGLAITSDPQPGDLVCYDWAWDGEFDHIGIFENWTVGKSEFTAIEGNTSVDNNSNGGAVMRRTRNRDEQATVFIKVRE